LRRWLRFRPCSLETAFQTVRHGPKPTRTRKVLVSVQVAVSCVLLILSSLFTRAVQQTFRTEVTFDFAGMTVVDPAFYLHNYTPAQARQEALELAARLRQLPGIDAASIAIIPPLRRSWIEHISGQQLYLNAVDPSYFAMMRLPILRGRIFGPGERDAVVVSESAARKLWPNDSPLGKSCFIGDLLGANEGEWHESKRDRTVVGVVKDSGANFMNYPESVEVYTAIDDKNAVYATILVHATNHPGHMSAAVKSASTLPGILSAVSTFQSAIDRQMETIQKIVTIVASLGTIASLLALLGIFGLLAFTVAQRTYEIGVRMALGARGFDVLQFLLRQYALPVGIGVIAGLSWLPQPPR